MADNSGATGILGVLVGALIVGGLVWFFVAGSGGAGGNAGPDINIQTPAAPTTK